MLSLRKVPDFGHIVVLRDVLSGAGDGNVVQENGEVDVELVHEILGVSLLLRKLAPQVEGTLGIVENRIHALAGIQLAVEFGLIVPVSQCQLVPQIREPVVDRGRRKHVRVPCNEGRFGSCGTRR